MTKRLYGGLAIVLVTVLMAGLILSGCGTVTTTTTTTVTVTAGSSTTTSATPTTTTNQQPIKLKFSCPFIEQEPPGIFANHFLDLVEEKSNGMVTFDRYFAEALAKHTEHLQLVSSGSVDLIEIVPTYVGQELVLTSVLDYPMFKDGAKCVTAVNRIMNEIPETKAILDAEQERLNIKILYWNFAGGNDVICRNEVTSLSEMAGMKINMWAPADVQIWGEFGMFAEPIYVADLYESLSRGVIDSVFIPIGGSLALNLFEASKSHLAFDMAGVDVPIIFNLDSWNSLPSDIQDIMMEASWETSQFSISFTETGFEQVEQIFRDAGLYVGDAPEAEREKLFAALMKYSTEEQWLNDATAAGYGEEAQILLPYWEDAAWGRDLP
ncbi:MAG: TRAP transporter substrate-binding protein DctP [Dehalococcoidales bacterium]|nr:TRAP transporter substrate-binding protein DctP [Dehalococcoidales bacterium]